MSPFRLQQATVLVSLLYLVLPASVSALPFTPDPISFSGYLSYQDWGDPSLTIRFEHLGQCFYNYSNGLEFYQCNSGYAFIKDAFATQKCRIKAWYDGYKPWYKKVECRAVPRVEKWQRKGTPQPSELIQRGFDFIFGN